MNIKKLLFFSICLVAAGACSGSVPEQLSVIETSNPPSSVNADLRRELLALVDEDQKVRLAAMEGDDPALWDTVKTLDKTNTVRMKAIIEAHGWPGKSLVGEDGTDAAWILIQHGRHDPEFLKRCLVLMEEAVSEGEAAPQDLAYLIDNVRMLEGRPQLYGPSFTWTPDGTLVPTPIEDEAHVDERRKAMNLPTMEEYLKAAQEMYLDANLPELGNGTP